MATRILRDFVANSKDLEPSRGREAQPAAAPEIKTKGPLLAKIVRELLRGERFESLTDVTEALKTRCARLKIPYTADDITGAYRLIESNHPLVSPARAERRSTPAHVPDLSRRDALALVARLSERHRVVIKTVPR